jgi:hypothetical protein
MELYVIEKTNINSNIPPFSDIHSILLCEAEFPGLGTLTSESRGDI